MKVKKIFEITIKLQVFDIYLLLQLVRRARGNESHTSIEKGGYVAWRRREEGYARDVRYIINSVMTPYS